MGRGSHVGVEEGEAWKGFFRREEVFSVSGGRESGEGKKIRRSQALLARWPLDFFSLASERKNSSSARSQSLNQLPRARIRSLPLAVGSLFLAPRRQRDMLDAPARRAGEKEAPLFSRGGGLGGVGEGSKISSKTSSAISRELLLFAAPPQNPPSFLPLYLPNAAAAALAT